MASGAAAAPAAPAAASGTFELWIGALRKDTTEFGLRQVFGRWPGLVSAHYQHEMVTVVYDNLASALDVFSQWDGRPGEHGDTVFVSAGFDVPADLGGGDRSDGSDGGETDDEEAWGNSPDLSDPFQTARGAPRLRAARADCCLGASFRNANRAASNGQCTHLVIALTQQSLPHVDAMPKTTSRSSCFLLLCPLPPPTRRRLLARLSLFSSPHASKRSMAALGLLLLLLLLLLLPLLSLSLACSFSARRHTPWPHQPPNDCSSSAYASACVAHPALCCCLERLFQARLKGAKPPRAS